MCSGSGQEDQQAIDAKKVVKSTSSADELAYLIVSEGFHPEGKSAAAERLLEMWKNDQGDITFDEGAVFFLY
ncbi:MAG: hypothetical protein KGH79_04470 [Patescibacteria group bacterium]|nr:hypothetical protein [Patescibacteria group bacterium]